MDYKTTNALDTLASAALSCGMFRLRNRERSCYRPRTGPAGGGVTMKISRLLITLVIALVLPLSALAQDKLGKVTFPTSCGAAAQAQFERGMAALHSYWFTEARKTFETIVQQEPGCAMASWGLAVNYLGNTLAFAPPLKDLVAGSEAVEKARAAGAKTQRERDWIEAVGAYYR